MPNSDPRTTTPDRWPISALLSQIFVAHVIALDNEFEHRMPHRTTMTREPELTKAERVDRPWLLSAAMWFNCLRFIPEGGITVRDLLERGGMDMKLDGMRRWGYVRIEGGGLRPSPSSVLRPTRAGLRAKECWEKSIDEVDERWDETLGTDRMDALRFALAALEVHLPRSLPDFVPILGYGFAVPKPRLGAEFAFPGSHLATQLSHGLVAFALEYESEAEVSLAIAANVLRATDNDGAPVHELPSRSGISKEAIAMAVGWLARHGFAQVEGAGRQKILSLTIKGSDARLDHFSRTRELEASWRSRFGADTIERVREAALPLVGDGSMRSPVAQAMAPYPDGWRASVRPPVTLPHFPTVLHRGGYPDGA